MRRSRAFILSGALAALALMVGAFAVAMPSVTHAASILYVGASVGTDSGCASPGYTSIQAAVNAANNGDEVYVCDKGSPYTEQVVIGAHSLTLTGDATTVIAPPATWLPNTSPLLPAQFASDNLYAPQALVTVWGVTATIKGLTIEGPINTHGSCAEQPFGILVIAGGTANVTNDRVLNIRSSDNSLLGCQYGVGIEVGRRFWPLADFSNYVIEDFVGTATITNTVVSGYQKNGITVDGPNSNATMTGSTITGDGPVTYIAQNGIQFSRGAVGSITNNVITGDDYSPCNMITTPYGCNENDAAGLLIWSDVGDPATQNVIVKDNLFTLDQSALAINGDTQSAIANAVTATQNCIYANEVYGAENDTPAPGYPQAGLIAEDNWWGSPSGPDDTTTVGGNHGTGDKTAGPVDYANWLKSPAPMCAGPVITNLKVTPNPAQPNAALALSATASDANTSSFSTIASAAYSIDGGTYSAMSATDGSFDQVTEAVKAALKGYAATGTHQVCVKATDAAGTTGTAVCTSFTVTSTGLSGNGSTAAPITAQASQVNAANHNHATDSGYTASGAIPSRATATVVGTNERAPISLALLAGLIVVFFGVVAGGALVMTRRRTQA